MKQKTKYRLSTALLIVILLTLMLGYAFLNANLNINGSAHIDRTTWNVYWDNVQVTTGSVEAEIPVIDSLNTTVSFNVHLSKPGDFYEFTIDAKNEGTVDAMIETIVSTINDSPISELPEYLIYSLYYADGAEIKNNQLLAAGTIETYKVRIEYNKDISADDLPASNGEMAIDIRSTYIQTTSEAKEVERPESFATDSWDVIINAIRNNNTSAYNLGDERTIDLAGFGSFNIRIVNKSTPEECQSETFSQTACGFVVDFARNINMKRINSTSTNTGGWPSTELRQYINSELYNAIPEEIRETIINTRVVSGHNNNESNNYVSTDKLFLPSTKEVWNNDTFDTASSQTRAWDYFNQRYLETNNRQYAKKYYKGQTTMGFISWWLRTPSSTTNYYAVDSEDGWTDVGDAATRACGVSPAFRVG